LRRIDFCRKVSVKNGEQFEFTRHEEGWAMKKVLAVLGILLGGLMILGFVFGPGPPPPPPGADEAYRMGYKIGSYIPVVLAALMLGAGVWTLAKGEEETAPRRRKRKRRLPEIEREDEE
jgi:hypothetical protein